MKKTNCEERQTGRSFFKLAHFAGMLLIALTTLMFTSCGDSDEPTPSSNGLVGTWYMEETRNWEESYEYGTSSIKMTLKFNKDYTGSIYEEWNDEFYSKATETESYKMDFSWSTTTDSNGNDILRVSYISGDKETEIFYGSSSTVLWTRQYVLTGKILNVYGGDGVWVFNKK